MTNRATYVDCNFPNVIYLIPCTRCSLKHVRETAQKLNKRFNWQRTGSNQPSKYSSPWERGQISIKLGTKYVIYQKLANYL